MPICRIRKNRNIFYNIQNESLNEEIFRKRKNPYLRFLWIWFDYY